MVRNQQLHDALKEYCEAAVRFIRSNVKGREDLPLTPVTEFEFTESGYMATSPMKINWMILEVMFEGALKKLPEYEKAVKALEADEVISKQLNVLVGTTAGLRNFSTEDFLRSILINDMYETDKMQEDVFSRTYQRMEDFYYKDTIPFRYIAPLNNFKMGPEKVELKPSFSIIKLSTEERASLLSRISGMNALGTFTSYQGLESSEYALEFYIEEPKVIGNRPPDFDPNKIAYNIVVQNFETALTALRLYKSGAVSYKHIIENTDAWNPLGGAMHTPQFQYPPFLFGRTYELANDEIQSFQEFWKQFEQARIKENALKIALSRLAFTYERGRLEDRLIDYIIALEALLLENEPELRFKFSLRGAALLDNGNPAVRKKVFHELHEGYKQRNNIAHGDIPQQTIKIDNETLPLAELIERVGNHVRSIIKAFIAQGKNKKQILKILNEKIIEGFPSPADIQDLTT
jgi:Apea-like HEPN